MRKLAIVGLLGSLATAGIALPAQAGCLTGAAVGGLAGHVVGHGVMGAAAGCAVGHHRSARRSDEYNSTRYNDGRGGRGGEYRTGPDRQQYGRDAYRDDMPR